jgi:ArsR family transcriptional regulator, lead/cadmium/zinc/bismuth-responsive transcriptional repressor
VGLTSLILAPTFHQTIERWNIGKVLDSACDHDPAATEPPREHLEPAATLFRAMGDPERLRLLAILRRGERCVSELLTETDKWSTVSARLQFLYRARLVHRRREAKHVYYRLADQHVDELVGNALAHAAEQHPSGGER